MCLTLDEDLGLGHNTAVSIIGLHAVDSRVAQFALADVQLGFVRRVRHGVLFALVQLTALFVPFDTRLRLAEVKLAGQGRRRLRRGLDVLEWRHDRGLPTSYIFHNK